MEKTRREIMDRVYLTYLPAKSSKPAACPPSSSPPFAGKRRPMGRCCRWCSSGVP
ncbi:MAG: hypothetical protein ACLR5H_06155 [Oscillospiraceae bacterium]